jgi:hypothetical protein
VSDCGTYRRWWGALTGKRGLVPEVGVLVLLMALDGLLEAADALHAGRKAVVISGQRPRRGCGIAVEEEGVFLSRAEQRVSCEKGLEMHS